MNKALLLRLHRWVALIFALPLFVVIVTGLILSVEPIATRSAVVPGSVSADKIDGLLQRYDPQGAARALFLRPLDNTLTISGGRPGEGVAIDLSTGERVADGGTSLSTLFGTARRIHESLLFRLGWLVTASTVAMLVLIGLGLFMGWPRLRNTVAGWHKGVAWILLPLVILSPLTGLCLALGLTFAPSPPPAAASGAPLPLREAVRVLGAQHDLSALSWIRPLGRSPVARVLEDGEMKTYALTREGAVALPRTWPRLIHEGTWGGLVMPALNLVTSLALLTLLGTGIWIWARRKLRRGSGRPQRSRTASAQALSR